MMEFNMKPVYPVVVKLEQMRYDDCLGESDNEVV